MTVAGDLNQRITLQERVKTTNTRGEVVYEWSTVMLVWAQANPLRGREFFEAAQTQSEITTRFRIRYREGIDATMRIIWKGEYYAIKAPPIEVNGQREWIDLMCRAGPMDDR